MYKKLISSILIVAFLNLLGCYSFKSMTVPEYMVEEKEDKPDEIYVKTKDFQEYYFSDSNFYIENDTLYADKGQKIALSDINTIEVESINWPVYILFVAGISAIIFIGFIAVFWFSGEINPKG